MKYLLAAAMALSILSSESSASIFDRDDRVAVAQSASAKLPIGIVSTRSILSGYSTGFLVSKCHVLTVRHLIKAEVALGATVIFSTRYDGTVLRSSGKIVAAGKFTEAEVAITLGQNRYKDWALVRLKQCIGEQTGYMVLSSLQSPRIHRLALAGFPIDRPRRAITLDPACRIRAGLGNQVLHDCATKRGNSGSPIIDLATKTVIAMHTAGVASEGVRPFDITQAGIAVPADQIVRLIEPIIGAAK